MAEDEIKKAIDEYARNKGLKLSKIDRMLSETLDAILQEVTSRVGKSENR